MTFDERPVKKSASKKSATKASTKIVPSVRKESPSQKNLSTKKGLSALKI